MIFNNIFPLNLSETKLALKLITQKENFILEDSAKAIIYSKKITPIDSKYTLKQYIREIQKITFAKTYSLPIDVENKLTWFSDKFLLKKSHLIRACYIYYIYKEEEKKNKKFQEKMHSIIPLYVEHVKLMRNKTT